MITVFGLLMNKDPLVMRAEPVTFKAPGTCTVSAALPSVTVLLALTIAPVPMAVAPFKAPLPTFASVPIIVLFPPVVFVVPAPVPKNELLLPVFPVPVPRPVKTLRNPAALNTRPLQMLYCVVALTIFDESVPPAVPLPLMLKLLDACGVLVF